MSVSGRIRERDLVVPTLQIAASRADGTIKTSDLIKELEQQFQPDGEDAAILDNRNDSKFSQIVRNLVSHKDSKTSIFSKGLAVHNGESESITITDAGRKFVDQLPE